VPGATGNYGERVFEEQIVMAYTASHRFARIAATKVRPFATLIRGKRAHEGLELLRFVPNRGARMLEKVLKSAMANAEDLGAHRVDNLPITEARVNNGPMFKRMQPRSRGMAFIIRRRFAHIHVVLG
jgi:large subunit ribosomal protein L22